MWIQNSAFYSRTLILSYTRYNDNENENNTGDDNSNSSNLHISSYYVSDTYSTAYAQDRCVSTQVDTGVKHTLIVCGLTHQEAKTSKDFCQLSDAKCSSSQTGFGSTKNDIKEHGNVPSK